MVMREMNSIIQKKQWLVQLDILAYIEKRKEYLRREMSNKIKERPLRKRELLKRRYDGRFRELEMLEKRIRRRLSKDGCFKWLEEVEKKEKITYCMNCGHEPKDCGCEDEQDLITKVIGE